ncbi:poly-gamma-glutamate hydrolase family protein [Proteiniclasticum sp. QWL-01]|jgi:phage replication-related protein YjqB (UPF0714/DUF867 family)|uniref:poly-gamma-glutamate hydrolase family protein n=1 Tax=Proteiniclasticum sp. QWL-01 TaxID=3036945 RepID=UPI002410DCC4|nr:poly-gamma-glutamate hydrolase family protein [Proteiniclasticum sp. QWL-01]WFF74048.1 poly-gamma-glutamate hydrolase family protein [Proteiniclasticum sp. QWL-01]
MADKYNSMKELFTFEPMENYRLTTRSRAESGILVMSPHGGGIEFFTSEIAHEVAGETFSLYDFAGQMQERNFSNLHVTSRHYDCSIARRLSALSRCTLAIHGCMGKDNERTTYLGGQDRTGRAIVERHLRAAGFEVADAPAHLSGLGDDNIVNQNQRGQGIQLEISMAQRLQFTFMPVVGFLIRKKYSRHFHRYCEALRSALLELASLTKEA